jgi:hypothetical protein
MKLLFSRSRKTQNLAGHKHHGVGDSWNVQNKSHGTREEVLIVAVKLEIPEQGHTRNISPSLISRDSASDVPGNCTVVLVCHPNTHA